MSLDNQESIKQVNEFVEAIADLGLRRDCNELIKMMHSITGSPPVLRGSIIGFGTYHYRYDSGHEGDSCLTGFSPRKKEFSIYLMPGYYEDEALMNRLGKFKAGKGCLYLKRLDDLTKKYLKNLFESPSRPYNLVIANNLPEVVRFRTLLYHHRTIVRYSITIL